LRNCGCRPQRQCLRTLIIGNFGYAAPDKLLA
jgi:hypothetical protein